MQLPVLLDRSRSDSLTMQLASQLREAIGRSMIPAGTRLPSTRRLSEQLGISRNTAVRAYDILIMEGFAAAAPASGIFAAKPPVLMPPLTEAETPDGVIGLTAPAFDTRGLRPAAERHRLSFDFVPGRPNAQLFPLRTWRRLLLSALSQGGATELSRHGDPGGLFDLRAALSNILSTTRGMVADPARIIITHGAQEAFALVARVLLAPGRTAVMEDPGYRGAADAFAAAGATLVGVPVDTEGVRPDALPKAGTVLYLTAAHQYPTGGVLPMPRRRAVVEWARRTGCVIVEDDYDGDLRYEGSPLPALIGTAPERTIHIGSFSETLGAGLRLGFMVVPPGLVEPMIAAKALQSHGNAWTEQAVLARFIGGGGYAAHLARLRSAYRESRDATLAALTQQFGEADVRGAGIGLHMLWTLPPGMPEAGTLEILARRARIGLYPLRSAATWQQAPTPLGTRGIVLGHGGLMPWQVVEGIARLSDAVDDRLDRHHDLIHDLLVHEPRGPAAPDPAPSLRHRLALRPGTRRRPQLHKGRSPEDSSHMVEITGIYRYPVKGLSAQPLQGIRLEAGRPFPFDRIFALGRSNAKVDPHNPQWAKKGMFVMLMLEEALATVRTHLDVDTMRLAITRPNGTPLLSADLNTPEGRGEVEALVERLVPTLRGRPTMVRSTAGHFMDKPDNVLSLINLATLRSLEERWGYVLDPLRFRANLYIDGARPWEEFDWIGGTLQINGTVLRVDRRNGRCGATNVNPATGQRDLELPTALRAAFGHKDLGVYLVTETSGTVVVGDTVRTPEDTAAAPAMAARPSDKPSHRFICQGCYHIYDEAAGLPAAGIAPGTPVAALPAGWRCPDCGTDIGKLKPYSP